MKIEAYFKTIKRANDTVKELQSSGFKNAFVDMRDNHKTDLNVSTNLAGTETSGSNSGLVLKSEGHVSNDDPRKSPLDAASPMVSGMGGFEEVADYNCKVVIETDSKSTGEVKDILNKMGAKLDSPDLNIPKHLEGIRNESVDM
jgi:hypothetical protein